MRLAGRGALVTGAGGGNGLRVVARRKYDGANVAAVNFEFDAFEADAPICRDLAVTARCDAMPREAGLALGGPDIPVNHAGITRRGDITRATDEDFASTMAGKSVAPGWIDNELNSGFVESMPDPEHFMKRIGGVPPVRRSGRPDELAAPATWLASPDAWFAAGRVHAVDSGRMAGLILS